MISNINEFKDRLNEERVKLEEELKAVASKDPKNPSNWDANVRDGIAEADDNLAADAIEDYDENLAITNSLEARLADVNKALENINADKFGICEVCSKEIEADRLEANPAAKTCKEHINSL
jgi:DnaK suppressor protein